MRRNPTRAEALLWARLRHRQLEGFKFRRQHIIVGFIVDFYCPMLQLAVEVDGPHHASQVEEDERRVRLLGSYGVRVVRVSAQEVIDRIDDVMEVLRNAVCQTNQSSSAPPASTETVVRPLPASTETVVRRPPASTETVVRPLHPLRGKGRGWGP